MAGYSLRTVNREPITPSSVSVENGSVIMAEYSWLLILIGGPFILGLLLALGMRQRRLSRYEREARDRATDRIYHEE